MKTEQLRNEVKKTVKGFGLKSTDVSVSVKNIGYSQAIIIKAKHENIDFKALQIKLSGFSSIDRCEKTGEILAGGNVHVMIYHPAGYTQNWNRI